MDNQDPHFDDGDDIDEEIEDYYAEPVQSRPSIQPSRAANSSSGVAAAQRSRSQIVHTDSQFGMPIPSHPLDFNHFVMHAQQVQQSARQMQSNSGGLTLTPFPKDQDPLYYMLWTQHLEMQELKQQVTKLTGQVLQYQKQLLEQSQAQSLQMQQLLMQQQSFFRKQQAEFSGVISRVKQDIQDVTNDGFFDGKAKSSSRSSASGEDSSGALEQFVARVTSFSSQYGTTSWAAQKVVGPPTFYPNYGDSANCWAPQNTGNREFLELELDTPVCPSLIEVYETSAPGAIVKISLWDDNSNSFKIFWAGASQQAATPQVARIARFERNDQSEIQIPFLTSKLRIDIDATQVTDQWYEIDAIKVTGLVRIQGNAVKTSKYIVDMRAALRSINTGGHVAAPLRKQIATLVLGERTWNVHKVILQYRCRALWQALAKTCGSETAAIEAEAPVLDISSCISRLRGSLAVQAFDALVDYIYSDQLPSLKSTDDDEDLSSVQVRKYLDLVQLLAQSLFLPRLVSLVGAIRKSGFSLTTGEAFDDVNQDGSIEASIQADMSDLFNDASKLQRGVELCDTLLKDGEATMFAHSWLLSARSDFFANIFSGEWQSLRDQQGRYIVEIELADANAFEAILSFIYRGQAPDLLDEENALQLFTAARAFAVNLDDAIEIVLKNIQEDNVLPLLQYAEQQFIVQEVIDKCAQIVAGSNLGQNVISMLIEWSQKLQPETLNLLVQHLETIGTDKHLSSQIANCLVVVRLLNEKAMKAGLEVKCISQYVERTLAVSSEYGNGWTVQNIIGAPSFYPGYGDSKLCWAPKLAKGTHEFIEFQVKDPIIPIAFNVYETYNPGAITSISIQDTAGAAASHQPSSLASKLRGILSHGNNSGHSNGWLPLYSGLATKEPAQSRIFRPNIVPPSGSDGQFVVSNTFRFDMDCTTRESWFEIDAVEVVGLILVPLNSV